MRDPEGAVSFVGDRVIRRLAHPTGTAASFLRTPLARDLADDGSMVPFSFTGDLVLEAPRLPFISLPYEWCDSQLKAAGELTLEISRRLYPTRHELKDASAWNVIFRGAKPTFCDHLSFQPIDRREWWAFGQFARHFLLPLGVSRFRGLRACKVFSMYRDGIPAEVARPLLGTRGRLSRLWPLTLSHDGRAAAAPTAIARDAAEGGSLHPGLYSFCESILRSHEARKRDQSAWSGYSTAREHYSEAAIARKREVVSGWLEATKGGVVVDLGCNTGEFSVMAAQCGAEVVAVDFDHDSVERLFVSRGSPRIHPLIADITDLAGGRGWLGSEFPGLAERLTGFADTVLMLALVHHLTIAEGIPLRAVVNLAADTTRHHAIVELIDPADPMVRRMAEQRCRKVDDLMSVEAQLTGFLESFQVLERIQLADSFRTLVLLERRVRPLSTGVDVA